MMKMVTAEFDWYTFLIIALGIVLGLAKNKKKFVPKTTPQAMPENEEEEEEGAGIEFDLRQAVIGSEILNRPRSLYPDV